MGDSSGGDDEERSDGGRGDHDQAETSRPDEPPGTFRANLMRLLDAQLGPASKSVALNAFLRAGGSASEGLPNAFKALLGQLDTSILSNVPPTYLGSMLPLIEASRKFQDDVWLNSDLLRGAKLPGLQLVLLSNQLAKHVDFGLSPDLARLVEHFGVEQASWIARLAPQIEGLASRIFPANLAAIEDVNVGEVQATVMLDGIALYGVPRTSIAKAILRAQSTAARRRILGQRWRPIVADCRGALGACDAEALGDAVRHTQAAIEALEGGHREAAQALIGSVIDTLVASYFGRHRDDFTPNRKTKNSDAYKRLHLRQYLALAPIWQAYQPFWISKNDPIPNTFSRHATVHTVSRRQYSRVNTVQALMIACGILLFLQEEQTAGQAS